VLVGVTDPAAVAEQLQRVARGRDKPLLVINADAQAPHQAVINVMEAARLANLPRNQFLRPSGRPRAGAEAQWRCERACNSRWSGVAAARAARATALSARSAARVVAAL